jgi:PAS domain S-box-containing protein
MDKSVDSDVGEMERSQTGGEPASEEGFVFLDQHGQITDWNAGAGRIFGRERAEVIGRKLWEVVAPQRLRKAYCGRLRRCLNEPASRRRGLSHEVQVLHANGTEFGCQFSLNVIPTTEPPIFVGFVSRLRNQSKRAVQEPGAAQCEQLLQRIKQLEALRGEATRGLHLAEKATKAKDHLLATLCHELRMPLMPAMLIVALLNRDERLPGDVREKLEILERNIRMEKRMVDDLFDTACISNGKMSMRLQSCNAHQLIGFAVEIVKAEAEAKQIGLRLQLEAQNSQLDGDPTRLQQVFWNLLSNAVKFTPCGGEIVIRSCDKFTPGGKGLLCIEVQDSGAGITPEAIPKIFLPFEQSDSTAAKDAGGMGLGLAIARAIVDLHHGTLSARSKGLSKGATFTVQFPTATGC